MTVSNIGKNEEHQNTQNNVGGTDHLENNSAIKKKKKTAKTTPKNYMTM